MRNNVDYQACDMTTALNSEQQIIMKKFLGFLVQVRETNHLTASRAMRIFRIELNGRFFRVKDGNK